MLVVHSDGYRRHAPAKEFTGGELIRPFDSPERVENIVDALKDAGTFEFVAPDDFGLAPIRRVHADDYLNFLETCHGSWRKAGFTGDAMASIVPIGVRVGRRPDHIEGLIGYYALSNETAIAEGTWEASVDSAWTALTAAKRVSTGAARYAFALCRPPGHHCTATRFGGYCYLNNAAIAAQSFLDAGCRSVAVLDIDFHHGNGTQDIFYERGDVLYCSVHGNPRQTYPFFYGFAEERGRGAGAGRTLNIPLPPGTGFNDWFGALRRLTNAVTDHAPEALVVSLGVDAHEADPQSFFFISTVDFRAVGRHVGGLGLPTAVIMEGGYGLDVVGPSVAAFLTGCAEA